MSAFYILDKFSNAFACPETTQAHTIKQKNTHKNFALTNLATFAKDIVTIGLLIYKLKLAHFRIPSSFSRYDKILSYLTDYKLAIPLFSQLHQKKFGYSSQD